MTEHFRIRTRIFVEDRRLLKTQTIFKTTYIIRAVCGNFGSSILISQVNNRVTASVKF